MKAGRRNTMRRLSRRGGKRSYGKHGKTCRSYKGGAATAAPGRPLINAVLVAAEALNAALGSNAAQRALVKRRLQIYYGTSGTWKKLRNGNNNAAFNNAGAFDGLPQNIKDLVETLLNNIIDVFEAPHGEMDYNLVMLHLIRNNLYHLTQQEYNDRNNFNDASTNYSNYGNNENNGPPVANENVSSPRSSRSNGNNSSNDPKQVE
jgi:hypothetical protein